MIPTKSLGYSDSVLEYLLRQRFRRRNNLRGDLAELEAILEDHGLKSSAPLETFEHRFGGLDGSVFRFGIVAMHRTMQTPPRLDGYVCAGRQAWVVFFMSQTGALFERRGDQLVPLAAGPETFFEQLALRQPLERRQRAMDLELACSAGELATELEANRVPHASDELCSSWLLPKGRGLILGDEVDTSAKVVAPSVHAAAKILRAAAEVGATSATAHPLRFVDVLEQRDHAPVALESPAGITPGQSFGRWSRAGLTRLLKLSSRGESPILEQWTLRETGPRVRAYWQLSDGVARRAMYLGLDRVAHVPAATSHALVAAGVAFDERLHPDDDDEVERLLFERGFSCFAAVKNMERQFGGVSFMARYPVQLGPVSLLRRDPMLTAREYGDASAVPVAEADERTWLMRPDGRVTSAPDDDGRARSQFTDAASFVNHFTDAPAPWKNFPYTVEA